MGDPLNTIYPMVDLGLGNGRPRGVAAVELDVWDGCSITGKLSNCTVLPPDLDLLHFIYDWRCASNGMGSGDPGSATPILGSDWDGTSHPAIRDEEIGADRGRSGIRFKRLSGIESWFLEYQLGSGLDAMDYLGDNKINGIFIGENYIQKFVQSCSHRE